MKHSKKYSACVGVALSALVFGPLTAAIGQGFGNDCTPDWTSGGGDIFNTRNAAAERKITPANVSRLTKKWEFVTAGDVSATPTVETQGNTTTVYAVDWGGYLYSINGDTGVPKWSHKISDYTGNTVKSAARTSPAIVGNALIIGDQGDTGPSGFTQGGGTTAGVMSVNKNNGHLNWRTIVSDHPFSGITSSPIVYDGAIYVGVSSLEENAGFIPGYTASFRGKVVALDVKTGALL